jgi:molecular chaperone GrpE
VDNLDRALSIAPDNSNSESDPVKDLQNLHAGLKMTETVLMTTLKKHGLERFDPSENGDKFDPNIHEAVFQTPQKDKEDGTVFHTQQKGFSLNGRVLRVSSYIYSDNLSLVLMYYLGGKSWCGEKLLIGKFCSIIEV